MPCWCCFCCRRNQNLRQLCGFEKAGSSTESVCPLCLGKRSDLLWYGTDDGFSVHCARHHIEHYGCRGLQFTAANGSPADIITAIEDCGFFESIPLWAVTLIGSLFVWVLSFVMILTVYGRFFKLYMYTAIAPVPLSAFAGEPTQSIGVSFLKSYAAVCLEGAIIVLACIIFSVFAATPPSYDPSAAAITMVWQYVGELIFGMLVLTGTVKMADRVVHEMIGV